MVNKLQINAREYTYTCTDDRLVLENCHLDCLTIIGNFLDIYVDVTCNIGTLILKATYDVLLDAACGIENIEINAFTTRITGAIDAKITVFTFSLELLHCTQVQLCVTGDISTCSFLSSSVTIPKPFTCRRLGIELTSITGRFMAEKCYRDVLSNCGSLVYGVCRKSHNFHVEVPDRFFIEFAPARVTEAHNNIFDDLK